jgi:hypothetical protein
MTDGVQMREIRPEDYPSEFIKALNSPRRLWDVSFRSHIPAKCRHLLYGLFFCSDFGVSIDELRLVFNALHQLLSNKYAVPHDPKDFEEALKILEGGYLNIRGKTVSFINPSLRDYLTDYLDDLELICDLAASAQKADWADRIWDHVGDGQRWSQAKKQQVARAFLPLAERFSVLPEFKKSDIESNTWHYYDLCFSERIKLLLSWFACSGENRFSEIVVSLADNRIGHFSAWRDATRLISLISDLQDEDEFAHLSIAGLLRAQLERGVVSILEGHVWPDDLESICDSIESYEDYLDPQIRELADKALLSQIENIDSLIDGVNSESTLNDYIRGMRRFASRIGISEDVLERAVTRVEERISEINESVETAESPDFSGSSLREEENFDDAALTNLFTPLIEGRG